MTAMELPWGAVPGTRSRVVGLDLPAWALWVAGAAMLRGIAALIVPVLPEESYHWLYAKHLDFGYYDHPPLIAWMIGLGTSIFGDTPAGIRFVPWLCSIGTAAAVASTARLLHGEKAASWTALLISCEPVTLLGSSFAFPDSGLLLFWALGMSFALRALKSRDGAWWLAVGACLGASMLSKYTGAFLGLSLLIYLAVTPQDRYWLKTRWPWLGALLALVVFSPVIFWNAQHDWASFRFQSVGRLEEGHAPRAGAALVYVLTQAACVMPLTVVAAAVAVGVAFRSRAIEHRFLLCLSLPLLGFFLVVGSIRSTHALWPLPGWIGVTMLTADYLSRGEGRVAGFFRDRWREMAVLSMVAVGLGMAHAVQPLPGLPAIRSVSGWEVLTARVRQIRSTLADGCFFLAVGRRYMLASQLAFHLQAPGKVHSKNLLGEEGLQFKYWDDAPGLRGRDAVIVAEADWSSHLEDLLKRHFRDVKPDGLPLVLEGSGIYKGREERYVFYVGTGYQPGDRP